ncbi:MAG: hypothetical protein JF614_00025 [Acidobacteria bacterium]|nr:hypothetical protein [Acidobacteriota bacterium]
MSDPKPEVGTIAWVDLTVPETLRDFYRDVAGWRPAPVADLDASIARCLERGGKVVAGRRSMGQARFCVIQDPAGAVAALYQAA